MKTLGLIVAVGFLTAVRAPVTRVGGTDHVPVAVADLEQAAARFRQLGFVLKPGRPHANGIRNVHAKFPDGTEIELIAAPEGVDPLTRRYREHLKAGDGPAFLSLFVRSGPVRPSPEGPLSYLFFGSRQASPTDRPEHFAHTNGARSLRQVWLAGDAPLACESLVTGRSRSLRSRVSR